jgi:pantetheine-phosphate adenylyltransferase
MTRALIPGSFDPVTVGHEDLISRAASMFDEVIVCAFENSNKNYMFSEEERYAFLKAVADNYENVTADISHKLVAEYAEEHGCIAIVKGSRSASDFDDEYSQALINRELAPEVETVILPASPEVAFISSTMVRELIRYGVDFSQYVPKAIREII